MLTRKRLHVTCTIYDWYPVHFLLSKFFFSDIVSFVFPFNLTLVLAVSYSSKTADLGLYFSFNHLESKSFRKLLVSLLAFKNKCFSYKGYVRLASLGLPRCAHSGEPLTRAIRTITLTLSWWRLAPQVTPKRPTPQAGHWGLTQVSPSKLFERTGADRGRLREAKRTHPILKLQKAIAEMPPPRCILTNNNTKQPERISDNRNALCRKHNTLHAFRPGITSSQVFHTLVPVDFTSHFWGYFYGAI